MYKIKYFQSENSNFLFFAEANSSITANGLFMKFLLISFSIDSKVK